MTRCNFWARNACRPQWASRGSSQRSHRRDRPRSCISEGRFAARGPKSVYYIIELRSTERHLPYGITVLPATQHRRTRPALTPAMQRDGRLSWPWWLVINRDSLPVSIQVVSNHFIATGPGVELKTFRSWVQHHNRYATNCICTSVWKSLTTGMNDLIHMQ